MKSPERPRAYIDYYNKGLLTGRELRVLTEPFKEFFTRNNIPLSHTKFRSVVERFSQDGSVFHLNTVRCKGYRADPVLALDHVDELKSFAQETERGKHSLRTEEERKRFQDQLLRFKDLDGTYRPLSLDETIQRLVKLGKQKANSMGWHNEAEDLAMEALGKILPYLQGEIGDFPDFSSFKKYYLVSLGNLFTDAYRRKKSEGNAVGRYTQELQGECTVFSQEDMRDEQERAFELSWQHTLAHLPPPDIQLFLRRNLHRNSWRVIANEMGENISTVKVRYHRILEELRTGRIKKLRARKRTTDDQMIAAYEAFSRDFIEANGRKPMYKDMRDARKGGKFPYAVDSLKLRFGNGDWSWEKTRENMEQMLEQEKQTVPSR